MIRKVKTYCWVLAVIWLKRAGRVFLPRSTSYQKFAIFCTARSGSTWLHTLLNSHPNVHSDGEIVLANHRSPNKKRFEDAAFQGQPSFVRAVGLKIFYENPIYQEGLQCVVADPSVKIILLRRRSILAQFVSLKLAERSKAWTEASHSSERIQVDSVELKEFQESQQRAYEQIDELLRKRDYLELFYEEMLEDSAQVLQKVQVFLGVKPRKLHSLLKKQGAQDVSSQISNWEEVKAFNT